MPGSNRTTPSTGVKLTYDDLVRMPEDRLRHELIDGEHYVTPSPNLSHQRIIGRLHQIFANWLDEHPIGEVFLSPFDVVISPYDVVVPDLLYMSNARAGEVLNELHATGAPELVIEVASKSTRKRDETIKRALYDRSGVKEYWTIDPRARIVRVTRRDGEGFGPAAELSIDREDVLTSPLLPGLVIPLARIFPATP